MTFITTAFRTLGEGRLRTLGMLDMPLVFLPHPTAVLKPAQVEELAGEYFGDVLRHALVAPAS